LGYSTAKKAYETEQDFASISSDLILMSQEMMQHNIMNFLLLAIAPMTTESHALKAWLNKLDSQHHKKMDFTLDRVRSVAQKLKIHFDCPVIMVGGTNGKGSSCAFLESIYSQAGFKVATHTKPHLLHFSERARFNQLCASDEALIAAFERVEAARLETLPIVTLTYHEFTLLGILSWFMSCSPDVVVLEVGLGGRLDAVNIIDADVSIVTSVDLDHTEYLGDNREDIGWEKAHIFRPGKPAICADPVPPQRLQAYAKTIGADLWLFGRDFNYSGDKQQWNWTGRGARRSAMAYPGLRGANQLLNASAALAAIEVLKSRLPVMQSAVRTGLLQVQLPGRFQVLPGQPTIILDVAHNPHAASVLAVNLDNMGYFPFTLAVFGAMADKDIAQIIDKLKDRIDHWLLTDLPVSRAATAQQLQEQLFKLGITPAKNRVIECCPSPAHALARARQLAGQTDRIVVFGSFYTVGGALESQTAQ